MLLHNINNPQDLKRLSRSQLPQLCFDVRDFLLKEICKIGGHVGSSLGVCELTVALHYVFNAPVDKIIFDIGHQSHIHKILTNRKDKIKLSKQKGGISGFCSREESEYDVIGAGHSSTSISSLIGMCYNKKKENLIAVIGDSSLSAGMAFEALNNLASVSKKCLIVVNDNEFSISEAVGALSLHLSSQKIINFEEAKLILKNAIAGNKSEVQNFFTSLGLLYVGKVDGHDVSSLVDFFEYYKQLDFNFPVILHIKTQKGNGIEYCFNSKDKFHARESFDFQTGVELYKKKFTFAKLTAKIFDKIIQQDSSVVAVSPAMLNGSGLVEIANKYKNNIFDVAIAEQHAVTFSCGLAIDGKKPFCFIYSTFLQRAYDQVIHDCAIQNLPVRFMIDRAGYVGSDGATHHGAFDVAFLHIIPNFVLMAPSDEYEYLRMVKTAYCYNKGPIAIRYPKESCSDLDFDFTQVEQVEIGKFKTINKGSKIAVIGYGFIKNQLKYIQEECEKINVSPTIIDARFAKPIDKEALEDLIATHEAIFTIEDGSVGGFGAVVSEFLMQNKFQGYFKAFYHKDEFLNPASRDELLKESILDKEGIFKQIQKVVAII